MDYINIQTQEYTVNINVQSKGNATIFGQLTNGKEGLKDIHLRMKFVVCLAAGTNDSDNILLNI